jgi:hypothetical protein
MSKSLYKITEEAQLNLSLLEEQDGVFTEEQEKALVISQKELESKGIAYLEVLKKEKAYQNMIDEEIKRLQARKKSSVYVCDRLESNLLLAQNTFGDFDIGLTTITTRKSESIQVEDVNSLPKEYKVIKIVETADKNLLKLAIKAGKEIEGVTLLKNDNLKIK